MDTPFFFAAASFVMSIALGIPAAILAGRLNLMDVPGSAPHKQHKRSTPLAGGLLIALVVSLMLIFRPPLDKALTVVLLGASVVFAFGLWDDRRGLSAFPKLIGQFIAAGFLLSAGVQVRFMTVIFIERGFPPGLAQALNIFFTLFWLIGITNAFNMIDSMDGIVAGVGSIAAMFFMGAAALSNQPILAAWSAVLLGLCLGLYYWNGLASRFFLGDSGSQTLGFLLASLGILYNPLNRNPESSWIVPIMLLSAPIFDTTLVVLSRFRRGQQIGSGRRDHTYHRLVAMKFSSRLAVLIVHLSALATGLIAFAALHLPPWLALAVFAITILLGMAALFWFERKPTLD